VRWLPNRGHASAPGPFGDLWLSLISPQSKPPEMAKLSPPRKVAGSRRRRSEPEGLVEFLLRTGPRHDLADAIEKAYEERHRGLHEGNGGRTKRRRSTRTS
jgi:hypothetical protein